jgi:hypothetical protein
MSYWRELFLSLTDAEPTPGDTSDISDTSENLENFVRISRRISRRQIDDRSSEVAPAPPREDRSVNEMSAAISKLNPSKVAALARNVRSVRCVTRDKTSPEVIAPTQWWNSEEYEDEPPFAEPCPERRGRTIRRDGLFLHFCQVCGAWGAFGYGVLGHQIGRWYCREHCPEPRR